MLTPEILTLEEVESTNTWLKTHPEYWKNNFFTLHAHRQTTGRGRLGRSWHSGPKDLTFSFIYRPGPDSLERLSTIYAGIAVCRALRRITGAPVQIKWPNDIVFSDNNTLYKAGGILTELVFEKTRPPVPVVIVGIGLNINSEHFPDEINRNPISLKTITGQEFSPAEIMGAILSEGMDLFGALAGEIPEPLQKEWKELSHSAGKKIRHHLNSGEYEELTIEGLCPRGRLITIAADGKKRFIDEGEIEYLP